MNDINLIVILGPTASGKTGLGVAAARLLGGEVVSADSRQVFRGMDLGTGKDLDEYGETPCHLIDIADAGDDYSVFAFQRDCYAAFEDVWRRQRMPLLVGGTGLYLEAVLQGYRMVEVPENRALRDELAGFDDEALRARLLQVRPGQHNRTDLEDRERLVRAIEVAEGSVAAEAELPPLPEVRPLVYGLRWPRELLRQRITARLRERLEQGMVDEVARLHAEGVAWPDLEFYGLEYRFVAQHLQGQLNRNDMFQKLCSAIHQFAKRQETWFRRMERRGVSICWLDGERDPLAQLHGDLLRRGVAGSEVGGA
ncbi:MAG: tRNA (adenosine(37)-N6)-dimethylallyltransferase MiaA [Desulfuromonas sp.]|nr:MAG: tRNA (adenosine(37)-N6)-dimethylallyltransferase MiaA [Desulfuromonas sp.]